MASSSWLKLKNGRACEAIREKNPEGWVVTKKRRFKTKQEAKDRGG